VASAAYQAEPAAAAAARRFVRDTRRSGALTGRSGDHDPLVDDAVLLTSELVTNAVLHAGTPVQVTCRLIASDPEAAVEIAVLDRQPSRLSPALPPCPRKRPTAPTGAVFSCRSISPRSGG